MGLASHFAPTGPGNLRSTSIISIIIAILLGLAESVDVLQEKPYMLWPSKLNAQYPAEKTGLGFRVLGFRGFIRVIGFIGLWGLGFL